VAGGDVDGDGYGDVVLGRGPGGTARVEVYSGRAMTVAAKNGILPMQQQAALLKSFSVVGGIGVYVAAADMNIDGRAEVVVGFDRAKTVSIYDGLSGTLISKRDLGTAFNGGVRVAARAGQVMVASGMGTSPTIQLFAYANGLADPWTLRASLTNEKIRGFTARNTRGIYVG
jgi:hypothetical protein